VLIDIPDRPRLSSSALTAFLPALLIMVTTTTNITPIVMLPTVRAVRNRFLERLINAQRIISLIVTTMSFRSLMPGKDIKLI